MRIFSWRLTLVVISGYFAYLLSQSGKRDDS